MSESVFAKAIRDFFSGKFLFLSLAPFVVPFIVLGGLLIYGSGELLGLLHQGASSGDFSFIDDIIKNVTLLAKLKTNSYLFGAIFLTRFWTLLETNQDKAVLFLEKAIKIT